MYKDYYKLKEMPYTISPDPRFLFMTGQHDEAIGRGIYVINERSGLGVIYGAIGMGKSTIARRLLELSQQHGDDARLIINDGITTKQALLRAILEEFAVPQKRSFDRSMAAFQEYMIAQANKDKNIVIIVDEAQNITRKIFQDVIKALLNFESDTKKFVQIILIGQNELATNIDKVPEIKSRVAMFGQLQNLMPDDAKEMIAFRWHTASAGKSSHPFTEDALEAIYKYSRGLPREINKICNSCLLSAYAKGMKEVSIDMVDEAALELRLSKEDA